MNLVESMCESWVINLNEDSSVDFIATAIEDEKKGEKIVLLISNVNEEFVKNIEEKILATFDNKLMIPSIIKIVNEIPKLGTGKKDFKGAKELALSWFFIVKNYCKTCTSISFVVVVISIIWSENMCIMVFCDNLISNW